MQHLENDLYEKDEEILQLWLNTIRHRLDGWLSLRHRIRDLVKWTN